MFPEKEQGKLLQVFKLLEKWQVNNNEKKMKFESINQVYVINQYVLDAICEHVNLKIKNTKFSHCRNAILDGP